MGIKIVLKEDEIINVKNMYESGMSIKEVGIKAGYSTKVIRRVLLENGVQIRGNRPLYKIEEKYKIYDILYTDSTVYMDRKFEKFKSLI